MIDRAFPAFGVLYTVLSHSALVAVLEGGWHPCYFMGEDTEARRVRHLCQLLVEGSTTVLSGFDFRLCAFFFFPDNLPFCCFTVSQMVALALGLHR